jgi:hypothetical protein
VTSGITRARESLRLRGPLPLLLVKAVVVTVAAARIPALCPCTTLA